MENINRVTEALNEVLPGMTAGEGSDYPRVWTGATITLVDGTRYDDQFVTYTPFGIILDEGQLLPNDEIKTVARTFIPYCRIAGIRQRLT